jgi:uncharacterized protein with HEPN domain
MSNRKFRDLALFVIDIFVAVHKIKEYIQPFKNENDFRHNSLHWDATIRQLEVIGEALNNLLDDDEFSALSPKYFRKVVNFRNTISHGYFGIDLDEVMVINLIALTDSKKFSYKTDYQSQTLEYIEGKSNRE